MHRIPPVRAPGTRAPQTEASKTTFHPGILSCLRSHVVSAPPYVFKFACMSYDDDSRLARRVQKGDRQAFEQILGKFERPIYAFIYHFFQNNALCEDLTQETFLRAFRFIDSFRPKEKLSTWLFSIARNLCIDELRKMQKGSTLALDEVDPEVLVAPDAAGGNPLAASIVVQQSALLKKALAGLPEKYRTAIILFYFNELSYEEISDVMKISLSNTKILLFRGKKMLFDIYREKTRGEM